MKKGSSIGMRDSMQVRNASVFTKEGHFRIQDIYVGQGRFTGCPDGQTAGPVVDGQGCLLIPGLIDIHFHGCAGYDLSDGTAQALEGIAGYELMHGITSICPAVMTLPEEMLAEVCRKAAAYRDSWKPGHTAKLCGINMEGPFIAMEKCGAQDPAHAKAPDKEMFRRLMDSADGLVKLVTVAPELDRAMEFIRKYADTVRVSLGHTNCDYETAMQAFQAGASHITHLFNAMPPLAHRSPGPVAAAFDTPYVTPELICDGVHIAPPVVRAAFALFGDDRIIFVSDSMRAAGMPDGTYSLGGLPVFVQGSRAVQEDGTLAGSVTDLMACLRIAVQKMGIPIESAIKAAAVNPARAIGIDQEYGSIEIGKYADFLLLDAETLELKKVFSHGILVYEGGA